MNRIVLTCPDTGRTAYQPVSSDCAPFHDRQRSASAGPLADTALRQDRCWPGHLLGVVKISWCYEPG